MKQYVEEKHRAMLKLMKNEISVRCAQYVRQEMKVDDLIGDNCPYSTFSNFITGFHRQTNTAID